MSDKDRALTALLRARWWKEYANAMSDGQGRQ